MDSESKANYIILFNLQDRSLDSQNLITDNENIKQIFNFNF